MWCCKLRVHGLHTVVFLVVHCKSCPLITVPAQTNNHQHLLARAAAAVSVDKKPGAAHV